MGARSAGSVGGRDRLDTDDLSNSDVDTMDIPDRGLSVPADSGTAYECMSGLSDRRDILSQGYR